jgi:pilus assembly protein Flp/PilA
MLKFWSKPASRACQRDERAASSVEYGLLAVAIAALIVVIVFALGGAVRDMFGSSCDTINSAVSMSASCTR